MLLLVLEQDAPVEAAVLVLVGDNGGLYDDTALGDAELVHKVGLHAVYAVGAEEGVPLERTGALVGGPREVEHVVGILGESLSHVIVDVELLTLSDLEDIYVVVDDKVGADYSVNGGLWNHIHIDIGCSKLLQTPVYVMIMNVKTDS